MELAHFVFSASIPGVRFTAAFRELLELFFGAKQLSNRSRTGTSLDETYETMIYRDILSECLSLDVEKCSALSSMLFIFYPLQL